MLEVDKHMQSWRERIRKSAYSQKEVADKIKMDKEYLNKLVNLKQGITVKTYKKIENALQKLKI